MDFMRNFGLSSGSWRPLRGGLLAFCLGSWALGSLARAEDGSQAENFGITVEGAGFAVYPVPTRGLALASRVGDGDVVEVSHAEGQRREVLATQKVSLSTIRWRSMVGSLSWVNFGIGKRTVMKRYQVRTVTGLDQDVEASMQALVAEVGFGSHVEIGSARISCDWLGVALPIHKIATADNFPSDAEDSEKVANDANFNAIRYTPSLQFVRLGLGVMF